MSRSIELVAVPAADGPFVWNVPHRRNRHFAGREQAIAGLRASLLSPEPNRHVQALWGLAGVGKTQLAMEYAWRFANEYQIVWWVAAQEPSSIALSLARLATRLGAVLPDGASAEEIRGALNSALAARSGWLLIFDNVSAPEDLRPWIAPSPTGHILVTSRNPNWSGFARPVPIEPLTRADAVEFLLERTGLDDPDNAATALAHALGDLPLALEQAGACIAQTRMPLAHYLREYETYWGELLRDVRPTGDYPDSVQMTWELACRRLERQSSSAADLMTLLAFLGPDSVPRELLRGAQGLPETLDSVFASGDATEQAIAQLAAFALILDDGLSTSMHRVVGSLIRDRLTTAKQKLWSEAAVRLMAQSYRFDSASTASLDTCAMLLPHALAAAFHAEANQVAPRATVDVLENTGRFLLRRAQFDDARAVLERAMGLAAQFYGAAHPRVAAIANNLGRLHRQVGAAAEAMACFQQALSIDRQVYGDADPHSAAVSNNLGVLLHQTGDRAGALQQFEWALQVFDTHYGGEYVKAASVINNLGYVLKGEGDLAGARKHFERAAEMARTNWGDEHPVYGSILANLAIVLRLQGELSRALELFEQALAIHQRVYGEQHPAVARDLAHLSMAFQEAGLRDAALEHLDRALRIDRSVYGEVHPIIAARLMQIGKLMVEMDDEPAARRCFERAAAIHQAGSAAAST